MYEARQNKEKVSRVMNDKDKSMHKDKIVKSKNDYYNITLSLKKKKNKKGTKTVYEHEKEFNLTQEIIQNFMIEVWKNNPVDEFDKRRAEYMEKFAKSEGGWCDGWAYCLIYKPDILLDIWEKVIKAIKGEYTLSKTDEYNISICARMASKYHVVNGELNPEQVIEAEELYSCERKDLSCWSHDEAIELELTDITKAIKRLNIGDTLRLTSLIHDSAVYKKDKHTYIVCETELSGIQLCEGEKTVCEIFQRWRDNCKTGEFFTQYQIVQHTK